MKQAVHHGCIPVVIQDDVAVEFEGILPYRDFAVRVRQRFFFQLPTLIDMLVNKTDQVCSHGCGCHRNAKSRMAPR